MTTKRTLIFLPVILFFLTSTAVSAQDSPYGGIQATPKHAWEIGLHGGHFFSSGDVAFDPSFGAGFHLRRALDYVFSLRVDGMYGLAKGNSESSGNRYKNELFTHNTTFASLTLQGVVTLNNLRWDTPKRKVNLYAIVGAGPVYTATAVQSILPVDQGGYDLDDVEVGGRQSGNFIATIEAGAGVGFRISSGFNIALEHKGSTVFGKRADFLDGVDNRWRDIINYTNLRLNFNLRKNGKLSEPLYWVNPLDVVLNDISELKARPVLDLTDTDKDGVIDILDQDKSTPPGAPVDTRGVPLDSDDDGIADFMDKEPYSPPGVSVDGEGTSQTGPLSQQNQAGLSEDEVKALINQALQGEGGAGGAVVEWFLPMIHFNIDSYQVRYSDYGNLANIASVLKSNPKMKLVVQGFTDKTASDSYNKVLSYNRAEAAINHLVNSHGIDRSRLVLQYGGEDQSLVPSSGSAFMNRRVEFRLATSADQEMPKPDGADKNKVSGSKDESGY